MSAKPKRFEEGVEKPKYFGGLYLVQSQFYIHYIDFLVPKNVAKNAEVLTFIQPNLICSKLCRTKIIPHPLLNDATEFIAYLNLLRKFSFELNRSTANELPYPR